MSLPQRKAPRLRGYDYTAPGAYFITICAKNRECLFGSIPPTPVGVDARIDPRADVPVFLTPLGQIVQSHLRAIPGVAAYVVMPNHLHCLIVVSEADGSGPMQASAPTVSQMIRVFKGKVAHDAGVAVFQRSFYDHVVRNETEYREIYDYILTNPARWVMDKFYIEGEEYYDRNR